VSVMGLTRCYKTTVFLHLSFFAVILKYKTTFLDANRLYILIRK